MADTPSAPVPVASPAEQLARQITQAWAVENAVRRERDVLVDRCLALEATVRSLRARVEPLERIARLADGLTRFLAGWGFDSATPTGVMVREIQVAIRDLRPVAGEEDRP